jgi:outer membrane protein OmpU
MKTLLLASTALVATASFAAADVTLTGFAEMGVVGGSDMDTQFHHDFDVTFTLSGESDSGLAFGATIDLDEVSNGINEDGNPSAVFVSFGGAKVTMGDTDGALDWAMSEVDYGASINDDHTVHAGFSGNGGLDLVENIAALAAANVDDLSFGIGLDGLYDGQIARAEYVFGDFAVAASLELSDEREFSLGGADWNAKPVYGIAGKYSANGLSVGIGYQTAKVESDTAGVSDIDLSSVGASVGYTMDAITAGLNIGQTKLEDDLGDVTVDHVGLGLAYTMNAITLAANYGQYNTDIDGLGEYESDGFGVSAVYDLGGGLSARFGYGNSNVNFNSDLEALGFADDDSDTYSLGLAMTF